MIDSYLRSPYQKLVIEPLLKVPFLKKTLPNALTLLALFTGITVFVCLFFKFGFLALLFLWISGFFDTLDGSLARSLNKTSHVGAVFDIFSDRVVETSVILGLYFFDPTRAISCLFMLASSYLCVTSFLVVGIFSKNESNKSFHYSPGMIERAEAFLIFSLMIVFPNFFFPLSYTYSFLVFTTSLVRIGEFAYFSKKSDLTLP